MSDKAAFITRGAAAYARVVVKHPGRVLAAVLAVTAVSGWLASRLTLESDQLSLISQDLPEVLDIKRIIDMVGSAGYLSLAFRGNDVPTLKKVADATAAKLEEMKLDDGSKAIRFVTFKVPIDFIQENMVLFLRTEDLIEGKRRINAYLKDQLRRNNPFFIELRKTEPVKLELEDLIQKYSAIGKKSIRDAYYLSDDNEMLLMLIKPNWGSTELQKTKAFIDQLTGGAAVNAAPAGGMLGEVAKETGVALAEDYKRMGDAKSLYFGFTGNYKTALDDSYAIQESVDNVFWISLGLVLVCTLAFFRRLAPTLLVLSGTVVGTVVTLGFAKLTLGELNMITSIIGALLLGFGIDFGLHLVFRTRIELGAGKRYDAAITDAIINAGRPALVASIVTAGAFFVLLASGFRGFSQFGFLAGFGTFLLGMTLFAWTPSILLLAGRLNPAWPEKLIGRMEPPSVRLETGETRFPRPRLVLSLAAIATLVVCAFAVPWTNDALPRGRAATLFEKLKRGVVFNYDTRALMPPDYPNIMLQDELNRRYRISSDPIAIATRTVEEVKDIWYGMTKNPETEYGVDTERFPTVDQVVSLYSFVPPPKTAAANEKVLAEWREELKDLKVEALPPELQDKASFFAKVLEKKAYGQEGVPDNYRINFTHLPTTKPENQGYLTFIYPKVDLWDGAQLINFVDETRVIKGASGKEYRSAGVPVLYAKLARIVLFDGKVTVLLAALWILLVHYLDFRSIPLAAASVVPLVVGLAVMLGLLSIIGSELNFMNLVILPILLGFGVSHGLYLLHRFLEGTTPLVALRSVGSAVAASTLTTVCGFASLFFAEHEGLRSIGLVACIGLLTTLLVSFAVLGAILQLIYNRRGRQHLGKSGPPDAARLDGAPTVPPQATDSVPVAQAAALAQDGPANAPSPSA